MPSFIMPLWRKLAISLHHCQARELTHFIVQHKLCFKDEMKSMGRGSWDCLYEKKTGCCDRHVDFKLVQWTHQRMQLSHTDDTFGKMYFNKILSVQCCRFHIYIYTHIWLGLVLTLQFCLFVFFFFPARSVYTKQCNLSGKVSYLF